jgi:hypothetical protein
LSLIDDVLSQWLQALLRLRIPHTINMISLSGYFQSPRLDTKPPLRVSPLHGFRPCLTTRTCEPFLPANRTCHTGFPLVRLEALPQRCPGSGHPTRPALVPLLHGTCCSLGLHGLPLRVVDINPPLAALRRGISDNMIIL